MSLLETALPSDRTWARLGDLYEITRKPRGQQTPLVVPFAPMDALPQGGAYEARFEQRPIEKLTSGTYFERGDILLAKITPSFENGKQALTSALAAPFGYATTEVIPLRPKDSHRDRRFLFFYLLHPDVRSFVAEKMEGATGRQRVPDHVVLDLQMPQLDEEVENSIADVLELVHLGSDLELRRLESANRLKLAALRELFTRGVRGEAQKESVLGLIPVDWKVERLSDHFSLSSGGTPSRANPTFWEGGTIPWVKTGEIDYRLIDRTQECITAAGLENSAAKILPAGTLLMAMYGQGVTRGKVGILGIRAACNQASAAFRPLSDTLGMKFLYYFLTYRYEQIRALSHGGQQQNLNMDIVRALSVAYPVDPSEQQEIVEALEAIDKKIEVHKHKHSLLEDLFRVTLHKLMVGEIRASDLDLSALSITAVSE